MTSQTLPAIAGDRLGTVRLGALAGMVAPAVFAIGVTLATWLGWDYLQAQGWEFTDHGDVPWPSGTALAEHGWVQSANFAVTGLLLLAFFLTWRRVLPSGPAGRIAGGLLPLFAVALALSAFNTDANFGEAPETWHGQLHLAAFAVVAVTSLTGLVATFFALRRDPAWRGVARLALFVAIAGAISFPFGGMGFLVYLVLLFGWFAAAAARLWQLSDDGGG